MDDPDLEELEIQDGTRKHPNAQRPRKTMKELQQDESKSVPVSRTDSRNAVPKETNEVSNDDERKKEDGRRNLTATRLTRLGGDPHPSNRDLAVCKQSVETEKVDSKAATQANVENEWSMSWSSASENLDKERKLVNDAKTIREPETTYQEEFPHPQLLILSSLSSSLQQPVHQPICNQIMDCPKGPPQPPQERVCPLTPVVPLPGHAILSRPERVNVRPGEEGIPVPPHVKHPRPGLLAVSHLVPTSHDAYDLPGPSFVRYGTTLVAVDPEGRLRTHKGHTFIHLYPSDTQTLGSIPPPPPPEQTKPALVQLFPKALDRAELTDRPERLLVPPKECANQYPPTPSNAPSSLVP